MRVKSFCGSLMRLGATISLLVTFILAGPALAATGEPKFAFGVFSSDVPEQVMSRPKIVVKEKSATFGWVAVFPSHHPGETAEIDVQEILELPAAPAAWILPGNSSLSHQGRQAEMRTTETISKQGYILKPHTFLPGDPLGIWHMTVIIDGVKSERFEFTVADPEKPESANNERANFEKLTF